MGAATNRELPVRMETSAWCVITFPSQDECPLFLLQGQTLGTCNECSVLYCFSYIEMYYGGKSLHFLSSVMLYNFLFINPSVSTLNATEEALCYVKP